MATGDAAAAAGLPVVPETRDLRLGYRDMNALADALVPYIQARIVAERDQSPTIRKISASNIPAGRPDAAGALVTVQTFLTEMFNRNSQNIGAIGPNGEATSIQSYLNLLNQAVNALQNAQPGSTTSATSATTPKAS